MQSKFGLCPSLIFLLALSSLGRSTPASADTRDWLLADRDDEDIRSALETVLPLALSQLDRYDSDAVLALHERRYELFEDEYSEFENRVWWVKRGEAEDLTNFVEDFPPGVEIKKVRAFRIRAGALDKNNALTAKIESLDGDRIRLQKGNDDDRFSNLVVAFETAAPGDLLGISIQKKGRELLPWQTWRLASPYPVTRAVLRLNMESRITYNVFGSRMPEGGLKHKILKRGDGVIRDIVLWTDDIRPILHEPHSPPAFLQSPIVFYYPRAEQIKLTRKKWGWLYQKHWNQVAVDLARIQKTVNRSTSRTRDVQVAKDLTGEEAAASLYHFVRDAMLDLPAGLHTDETPTVDDALEHRTGTAAEKSFVLAALLEAHGMEPEIVWAHNPNKGDLFMDHPSLGQIDRPLIRLSFDDRERWYDVGCVTCVPGETRPELRGELALRYTPEILDLYDIVIEQLEDISASSLLRTYYAKVGKPDWTEWVLIPGTAGDPAGFIDVSWAYADASCSSAEVSVRSAGVTSIRYDAHRQDSAAEAFGSWQEDHLPRMNEFTIEEASESTADTLQVAAKAECPPLAPPTGDAWVLPAELLYGSPVIGKWPATRLLPFYVARTLSHRWTVRVPLPPDWEDAVLPEDQAIYLDLLDYRLEYRTEDGVLIVTRQLVERKGEIDDADRMAFIGEQATAVHDFETSPVVLTRKETGR